jgi:hypothetical protein
MSVHVPFGPGRNCFSSLVNVGRKKKAISTYDLLEDGSAGGGDGDDDSGGAEAGVVEGDGDVTAAAIREKIRSAASMSAANGSAFSWLTSSRTCGL